MPGQRPLWKHLLASLVFLSFSLFVAWVLVTRLNLKSEPTGMSLVGKPAIDFTVDPLFEGGKPITLAEFKGQPLIINFWASWCISCQQEADFLQAFYEKHKVDGVRVIGIAVQDHVNDARRFAADHHKSYPLGIDEKGTAAINYGVTGLPETIFIDERGVIQHKEAGPLDVAGLELFLGFIQHRKSS